MKKWIAILTAILFLTSCQVSGRQSLTGDTASTAASIRESLVSSDLAPTEPPAVPAYAESIDGSGSISLSCSYYQLIQSDMEFCDEIAVSFDGQALTVPICLKDRDVDLNMPYLKIDENSGKVTLTMYKADFSKKYGVDMNTQFTLSLAVKGGYQHSYFAHQLHRSSNPLGHKIYTARPPYADQLLRKSGIQTVINLANDKKQIREFLNSPSFASPGYQSLLEQEQVFYCHASTDLTSPEFTGSLIQALDYMAEKEGPYLIHCNEGSESWQILAEGNILTSLSRLFIDENEPAIHTKELETLDLADAASSYLQQSGLSHQKIEMIQKNLN